MCSNHLKKTVKQDQYKSLIRTMTIGGSISALWGCHRIDVRMENKDHIKNQEHIELSPLPSTSAARAAIPRTTLLPMVWRHIEETASYLEELNDLAARVNPTPRNSLFNCITKPFEAISRGEVLWKNLGLLGIWAINTVTITYLLSYYLGQWWFAEPPLPEDSYLNPNLTCTQPDQRHTTGDLKGSWVNTTASELQACGNYCFNTDIAEYEQSIVNGSYKNCTLPNNETIIVAYHLQNPALLLEQCKKVFAYFLPSNDSINYGNQTNWLQSLSTCDTAVRQGRTLFIGSLHSKRSILSGASTIGSTLGLLAMERLIVKPSYTKSGARRKVLSTLKKQVVNNDDSLPSALSQLSLIIKNFIKDIDWETYNPTNQEQITKLSDLMEGWSQSKEQWEASGTIDAIFFQMEELLSSLDSLLAQLTISPSTSRDATKKH